jgi:hypothetical protein
VRAVPGELLCRFQYVMGLSYLVLLFFVLLCPMSLSLARETGEVTFVTSRMWNVGGSAVAFMRDNLRHALPGCWGPVLMQQSKLPMQTFMQRTRWR